MVNDRTRIRLNLKEDDFSINFSLHDAVLVNPRFEFNTFIFEILEGGKFKQEGQWVDIVNGSFLIQKVDLDFSNVLIYPISFSENLPKQWQRTVQAVEMDVTTFAQQVNENPSSECTIVSMHIAYCGLVLSGMWMREVDGESEMANFTMTMTTEELWVWSDLIENKS